MTKYVSKVIEDQTEQELKEAIKKHRKDLEEDPGNTFAKDTLIVLNRLVNTWQNDQSSTEFKVDFIKDKIQLIELSTNSRNNFTDEENAALLNTPEELRNNTLSLPEQARLEIRNTAKYIRDENMLEKLESDQKAADEFLAKEQKRSR